MLIVRPFIHNWMGNLVLMVLYVFISLLIKGMVAPCVMDVKIGAKTYGPMATPAKIAQEDAKYLGTKKPLGKKNRFYYILVLLFKFSGSSAVDGKRFLESDAYSIREPILG